MIKKELADDLFPPLLLEALAYPEAGHASMAALFDVPIKHVALAERCQQPEFNAHTVFDFAAVEPKEIPAIKYAIIAAASEHSEQLSPKFPEFKSLHKRYSHLRPFNIGVRNDLIHGLNAMVGYMVLGLAESTAKQYFKRDVREPAGRLVAVNARVVTALAENLRQHHFMTGQEVRELVSANGGLTTAGILKRFHIE